jgi:hypothetical protein
MSRDLLVAGDAASIPATVTRARALADEERGASFVLLTPRPRGIQDRHAAEHVALANEIIATAQLQRAGIHLERAAIGDESPLLAVEDQLRLAPTTYEAVVLATRPPGLSRLLGLDVHARARKLPLPVLHVYAGREGGIPDPLIWRARAWALRALDPVRALGRAVEQRRLGTLLIVLPMLVYLSIGLGLALFVNRRFFFTDAVALGIDVILVTALLLMERADRRRLRRRLLIEEATDAHRERHASAR